MEMWLKKITQIQILIFFKHIFNKQNRNEMKKIENHFDGKTTYIVGKLIVNGCQSFEIDKLDEVCEKFEVSDEMKQEVIELYNSNDPSEDWDKLVDDSDWHIRMVVANQGYGLDKLVNDEDCHVRKAVANQGYGLDKLVNVRIVMSENKLEITQL